MSPRYPTYAEHVDEQERIRVAAREHAADKEASLERVSRKHGITSVREPSPYARGGVHRGCRASSLGCVTTAQSA